MWGLRLFQERLQFLRSCTRSDKSLACFGSYERPRPQKHFVPSLRRCTQSLNTTFGTLDLLEKLLSPRGQVDGRPAIPSWSPSLTFGWLELMPTAPKSYY
jgi:hypothetical protein